MAVRAAQGHLDLPDEILQPLRAETDLYATRLVNRYRWKGDPTGDLSEVIRGYSHRNKVFAPSSPVNSVNKR